jgi:hypothetical protein
MLCYYLKELRYVRHFLWYEAGRLKALLPGWFLVGNWTAWESYGSKEGKQSNGLWEKMEEVLCGVGDCVEPDFGGEACGQRQIMSQ